MLMKIAMEVVVVTEVVRIPKISKFSTVDVSLKVEKALVITRGDKSSEGSGE